MANAGAAITLSQPSALPVPTLQQVEAVLESGVVSTVVPWRP